MTYAIEATGLVKRYKSVVALDGLDLAVPEGTVTGLLGPNGAGKTTAVRVFTTLITPDAGHARVGGLDVVADADQLRQVIGLSGQYAAVDEDLTGFENLDMVGRLYHLGRRASRERARELLEQFDLTEAADRTVKGYSGGMRRRLDLAGALVARPPLPTSRPPVSTCAAVSPCGRSSPSWSLAGARCCSPPSTSKRPTGWPTRSPSSTVAGSLPVAPPTSSRIRSAASDLS